MNISNGPFPFSPSNSIDPNGHFLTDHKYFDPETSERPYFKRVLSRNKNKKDPKAAKETSPPVSNDWIQKVQIVNLAKYVNDPKLFHKIVDDVIAWHAEKKIDPYISATYRLGDVNKAIAFMERKKCLGKVLIDTAELQAKLV